MSEASKWRHIVAPYLIGNGIELATGGDPIVPTSIQFELTPESYAKYNSGQPLRGPVHWRDDNAIFSLPFKDGTLDYVASSHLLEDFEHWEGLFWEWTRVLKTGGRLIVCLPDKERFRKAVAAGQPPNLAHRRESRLGELSEIAPLIGFKTEVEMFTECPPGDYNIFWCGKKIR